MKKMVLIFCIAAFASGIAVGTDKPMYISRTATIHLSVNDVSASDEIIIDLITEYGLVIENLNKDGFDRVNDYVLLSSQEQFPDVVNKIELLGITTLNKIETINNVNELKGIDFDLEYFAVQKEQYQNELRKMNTSQNDKYYQKLWEADRDFDQSIYEKRKIRLILLDEVEFHRIILKISEKEPQDLDVSDGFFELINMPGIESHFFHIENPVDT
ncbi:MAG: hypothetical protein KAR20_16615, partial [Candidatus Heimdallarchaeota archaeon]|nr:hypothetical protein [Candidatus Heimdallarchaeota archaeon]